MLGSRTGGDTLDRVRGPKVASSTRTSTVGGVVHAARFSLRAAFEMQATAAATLGSPMYATLHRELADRYDDDPTAAVLRDLLEGRSERPVHDAVVLRLAGAVHRLVLSGAEPELATYYPSMGGRPRRGLVDEFLRVVDRRRVDVDVALDQQVQTNEVGRAALLAGGFCLLARRFGRPVELMEIGASAGLNLRWDSFWYDTGHSSVGDPHSEVGFTDVWTTPPLLSPVTVVGRQGCDIAPLDAADPDARLRLLSFVWPDQPGRLTRIRAALTIAERVPVAIDRADAAEWLTLRLGDRVAGTTGIVYHSIVWQYLPSATQQTVTAALHDHGTRATVDQPLAWLRMEPAGAVTDLRLTSWPGGHEEILATGSIHGARIEWSGTTS